MYQCVRKLQPSNSNLFLSSRSYASASTYAPRSNRNFAPPPETRKPKPASPSFFTARASFNDTILELQSLAKDAKHALRSAHIVPNNTRPLKALKGQQPKGAGGAQWKNAFDMGALFASTSGSSAQKKLPTGNYRKVLQVLSELSDYRTLARGALLRKNSASRASSLKQNGGSFLFPEARFGGETLSPPAVFEKITELIRPFQRPSYLASQSLALPQLDSSSSEVALGNEENSIDEKSQLQPVGAKARHGQAHLDELGRAYALGRRKESSARVWVVPTRKATVSKASIKDSLPESTSSEASPSSEVEVDTQSTLVPEPVVPLSPTSPYSPPVRTTEILINNIPLHAYFQNPADRESIVFPFKATGTLGKYNVFALVRGGGTTGQAGAVALGISRGIKLLWPVGERILKRYDLLRRDPRMVERKKTGLAKARKRYAWVKR